MRQCISLFLCLLLLAGCAHPLTFSAPGTFYYCRTEPVFSGTEGIVAPEERELSQAGGSLEALVELYCAGPEDPTLFSPLPRDCQARQVQLERDTLRLQFDQSLAQLSGIELTLVCACLAQTFLPLTGAQKLVLTAQNTLLSGQSALTCSLQDLDFQDNSLDRLQETCTIYYTDSRRRYLIPQEVRVNLASEESPELDLLQRMTNAPSGSGLRSALPRGTEFQSVRVEDGLCTVDLNRNFDYSRFQTSHAQLLSLMAVVNTLTSLEHIERVEFTIDGNLLIRYGNLSITAPLARDPRFLGPVRTGLGEVDGTLYVYHAEEAGLIELPARLHRTGAVDLAEVVMNALLSDPGTNGFATGIPGGTRLLGLNLEEGLCTVDLSTEYLQQPEKLFLAGRVIAASLCALEDISQVCITVNGGVPQGFPPELFGVLSPNSGWFL